MPETIDISVKFRSYCYSCNDLMSSSDKKVPEKEFAEMCGNLNRDCEMTDDLNNEGLCVKKEDLCENCLCYD